MRDFADRGYLDVCYASLAADDAERLLTRRLGRLQRHRIDRSTAKARTRDHLQAACSPRSSRRPIGTA